MLRLLSSILLFFFSLQLLFAQQNKDVLLRRAQLEQTRWLEERIVTEEKARELGLPVRQEMDGRVKELQFFRNGFPYYYITYNLNAAKTTSTDKLWDGGGFGFSLSGQGETLGIWDGGGVRLTHQEFSGRVTQGDSPAGLSYHATHVAGTMMAAGVDAEAKGMAYQSDLVAFDWNNDLSEMTAAAAQGLRVSNHSYGFITGWHLDDGVWYWYGNTNETEAFGFGYYDATSHNWDMLAYDAPYYLIVKAAGNDRGTGPDNQPVAHYVRNGGDWEIDNTTSREINGGADGFDCLPFQSVAKNILTVGAVNDITAGYSIPSDVAMTTFSSWGPTDDGRVKPDLVANGVLLLSPIAGADNQYGWSSGTSMAAPNVSGTVGLLLEHYRALHGHDMIRSASMKGVLIHTAHEAGNGPGPDYSHGWGLLNGLGAAQLMSQDARMGGDFLLRQRSLSNGETITIDVYASGDEPLKATLVWTDPPGTPELWGTLNSTQPMLVNDLDMRITHASTTTYSPFVLDPAAPAEAAITGDNFRDNVEQILISEPDAGEKYSITIDHKGTLENGPQDFSLIISGIQPLTYAGTSSDWHDPNNWLYGDPADMEHVTIPAGITNTPTISGVATVTHLVVEDQAGVIIAPGGSLTVDGSLSNYAGPQGLHLQANANAAASLIHTGEGVAAVVDRFAHGLPMAWQSLASAVSGQAAGEIYLGDSRLFGWHEGAQQWVSLENQSVWPRWDDANDASPNLIPARGYLGAFDQADKNQAVISLKGGLNQGLHTMTLSVGSHPDDPYRGMNLLGNPYPSAIDWKAPEGWTGRENLQTVNSSHYRYWIWNPVAGNYGSYDTSLSGDEGTNKASRYIPPQHAFWVQAQTPGSITVDHRVQLHHAHSWDETKSSPSPARQAEIRLVVSGNQNAYTDEIMIIANGNAGGVPRLFGMYEEAPALYMLSDQGPMAIGFVQESGQKAVDIGFEPGSDGVYQLRAIANDAALWIEDRQTATWHNLSGNVPFEFMATRGDLPHRFRLWTERPLGEAAHGIREYNQNPVILYDGNMLAVQNPWGQTARLEVFSANGQLVYSQTAQPGMTNHGVPYLPPGIYMLRMMGAGKVFHQKMGLFTPMH